MKVIAVLSEKGGAGKTTVTVHLAVAAQLAGLDVAVIDLDPQGSAADWCDRRGSTPGSRRHSTHPAGKAAHGVARERGGPRSARHGVVRLTYRDRRSPKQDARSHRRHRIPPFARRFGSKDPQR
jgi:hypothetical protein